MSGWPVQVEAQQRMMDEELDVKDVIRVNHFPHSQKIYKFLQLKYEFWFTEHRSVAQGTFCT